MGRTCWLIEYGRWGQGENQQSSQIQAMVEVDSLNDIENIKGIRLRVNVF